MEILSSDTAIAETFNYYFSKVVQNLNIPKRKLPVEHGFYINQVLAAIEKYKHNERTRPG